VVLSSLHDDVLAELFLSAISWVNLEGSILYQHYGRLKVFTPQCSPTVSHCLFVMNITKY